jgi:hypothetical protein
MKRKFQVRFLGGSGAARLPSYPVEKKMEYKPTITYCGFICFIIIPIMLLINKEFFGRAPFIFAYGTVIILFFLTNICQSIITGEVIRSGFSFKRNETPISYYSFLTLYSLIVALVFYGLMGVVVKNITK